MNVENTQPKVLICPQCGEGIKESYLAIHMKERCFFRPVSCPNYGVGCNEIAIPLNNIHMHLLHDCKAEKAKEEMITKSKKRDEYIQCSTCGYQVELRNWKKHERELCENRLVQCKNHVLGCSVMVPMSERDLHELIDENYERFCLYFSGHGSYIHVLESDISCPWTAEFWLYRPLPQDSLRIHLRNFFNLLSSYEIAFLTEIVTHNKVMKIVNALKDDSLSSKPVSRDGKKLSKAEKQKLQNEQMQLKMNLLNELTSLIPVYSDAVLAFIRAFQPVAICIEASLDCIRELSVANHDAWDQEAELSLLTEYPGDVAVIGGNRTNFGNSPSKSGNTTARSDIDPKKMLSRAPSSTWDDEDNYLRDPEFLRKKVELSPVASLLLLNGKSSISQYLKYSYYSLAFQSNTNGEHQDQLLEKSELDDKFTKMFGYTQLPERNVMEFVVFFLLEPLSAAKKYSFHPKIWTKLLGSFSALLKSDFDQLQDLRIEAGLITPDNKSANMTKMKSFKAKPQTRPRTADDSSDGENTTADNSDSEETKKEKKRKKKEKERQRRELKKLQSKKIGLDGDETNDENSTNAAAEDSTKSNEGEGNSTKKETGPKLISRVTDLLRSGCGVEILNESNTVNDLVHRSHICIGMYSGLSLILEDPNEDTSTGLFSAPKTEEKNHYYELLINPEELQKMAEMKGQLGFVSASSNSENESNETTNTKDNEDTLLTELLGTQAVVTEVTVTRGKWSHIALSATRKPQNRVLVYLDGILTGNFRECSFPLPMLSLGGSPYNLFSFSGLLLDVRYWSYQRNTRQINDKLHGLIQLSLNKIANHSVQGNNTNVDVSPQNIPEDTQKSREDKGLIAWWTFEDGPEFDVVTDVTRHRFKTRLIDNSEVNFYWNGSEAMKYDIPNYILSDLPQFILIMRNYLPKLKEQHKRLDSKKRKNSRNPTTAATVIDHSAQIIENTLSSSNPSSPTASSPTLTAVPSYVNSVNNSARNLLAIEEDKQEDDISVASHGIETIPVSEEFRATTEQEEKIDEEDDPFDFELDFSKLEEKFNEKQKAESSQFILPATRRYLKTLNSLPQLFYNYFIKYKWMKAESVKTNVSLLAYDIPRSPKAVITDPTIERRKKFKKNKNANGEEEKEKSGKKIENQNEAQMFNAKKPLVKIQKIKPKNKKQEKKKKLPIYLLQERIMRDDELKNENQPKGDPTADLEINVNAPERNLLPIPSFREQNICPFELRRHRLARYGRELQRYVICPLNCNEQVKKLFLRFHVQFECPRRLVACYYENCNMIFPFNERENHERTECIVSKNRALLLEEAERHNQLISCSLCSEEVKIRDYEHHQQFDCSHRLVFCPNDDCSLGKQPLRKKLKEEELMPKIPANMLDHHLKFDCDSFTVKNRYFPFLLAFSMPPLIANSLRCILIERGRSRANYPRPWGITISEDDAE